MIIQDDNFVETEIQNLFRNIMLFDSGLMWHLDMATAYLEKPMPGDFLDSFQFSCILEDDTTPMELAMIIFNKFVLKNDIDVSEVLRAKVNILTKSDENITHIPHVDTVTDHNVFLYYLNNADGDTIIFNKAFYELESPVAELEELKELKRISPKMGRGIVFNGLQYHASSSPTNSDMRVALNIVFR